MRPFLHDVTGTPVPAIIPVLLGLISLSLALLSVYLALQNHRRKTGAYIRGSFTPCRSRDCDDDFIAEIILENLKDRAVTVFGIYIRIGFSLYLTVEEFDDKPLILKPFETYVKSFGPIEFYVVNLTKIAVRGLLSNPKVSKRILLSTSEGKYKVRTPTRRWSPTYEYFSNHFTGLIRPIRSMHNEQSIGSNVKFVIDFVNANDTVETVPIHTDDYQLKLFRNFNLTRESLVSKESLEQYLHQQQGDGKLPCKSLVVYDLEAWRANAHDSYKGTPLDAEPLGFLQYHIIGKLVTRYQSSMTARKNARLLKGRQTKQIDAAAAASKHAESVATTRASSNAEEPKSTRSLP